MPLTRGQEVTLEQLKRVLDIDKVLFMKALESVTEELDREVIDRNSVEITWEILLQRKEAVLFAYSEVADILLQKGDRENLTYVDTRTEEVEFSVLVKKVEIRVRKLFQNQPEVESFSNKCGDGEKYHMKLPKRELPKYGGDVRGWLSFWPNFEEIHNNATIPEIEKFHYLLQCLVSNSPAHKIVSSFPISKANYQLAVDALTQRFGRKKTLIKVYVRDLLKLVVSNAQGGNSDFIDLVTELTSQIRNLEQLGVTKDKCADILHPVVESCIPEDVLMAWQRSSGFKDELEALIDFLQREVSNKADRVLARTQFIDDTAATKSGNRLSTKRVTIPAAATFFDTKTSNQKPNCIFCSGSHSSHDCGKAASMSLEARREAVKSSGHCFACLKKGHSVKQCKAYYLKCAICKSKHHALMCSKLEGKTDYKQESITSSLAGTEQVCSDISSAMTNAASSSEVPLQTLMVTLVALNGQKKKVRALLDTGAQKSYILESLATELQLLKVGSEEVLHQLFGGVVTGPIRHDQVKLHITALDGANPCTFEALCIPKITDNVAYLKDGKWIHEFKERGVHFSDLNSGKTKIEILIGNDLVSKLYTGRRHMLAYGPIAVETIFGWVLCGKLPCLTDLDKGTFMVVTMLALDRPLTDLWALETIGIRDDVSVKKQADLNVETQQHFEQTLSRQDDGRYQVKLPWLSGLKRNLPSNYAIAKNRLYSTTRRLQQNNLLEVYHSLFQQWEQDKMIKVVDLNVENGRVHYLPHRAVLKNGSTTPVRPVFDASAKQKGGTSLNECLEKGPNKLEVIPAILTRFRMDRIGITADIKRAFQQISVDPSDRDFLRFLWWTDTTCTEMTVYRHNRVVFGVSSSPFLLAATLEHHLTQAGHFNHAAVVLLKSLYVDNCVVSVSSMEEAIEFKNEAQRLLQSAMFDLRGWELGPSNEEKIVPVLGLLWNTKSDTLSMDLRGVLENLQGDVTQRKILSLAHMLYDPLGFVTPFVLQAKLLLRKCHECKVGWDKPIIGEIQREFDTWRSQVSLLQGLTVNRNTGMCESSSKSLHIFADASRNAYAATVFLRIEKRGNIEVHLIQAKSRVAPLKSTSIPRLELLSCTIAARLGTTVLQQLEVENIPATYWTDSSTALAWITGDGPWALFVSNRVKEIRKLTDIKLWRHVPGVHNPADLPSRGCNAKQLVEGKWWDGVAWLRLPVSKWPTSNVQSNRAEIEKEMKRCVVVTLNSDLVDLLYRIRKLSSFSKMCRVMVYVLRFIARLKMPFRKSLGVPDNREMEAAEKVILTHVQKPLVGMIDKLKGLRPFLDPEGILRTRTRLLHEDTDDFKNPIILPNNDEVVKMLIMKEHKMAKHAGTSYLMSIIREKYWVISARRTISTVIHNCASCRRFLSNRLQVAEAPLPVSRTLPTIPFQVIGVDAAGPLYLRNGKKVWIILYTCAVYRAVHMECTDTLSTEGFIRTLRRFVARRGRPSVIYSDNGLNFVGTSNAFKKVDFDTLRCEDSLTPIEWRFNPPAAPWWGGWWERIIGLIKQLIRRNLGNRVVDMDELYTLIIEVENVVNSRPLTYVAEDPNDPVPLTPNMFLRESRESGLPEACACDHQSLNVRIKHLQRVRAALKSRFRREYLGQLLHRTKTSKIIQLNEGDVVLVELEGKKRLDWPIGVIMNGLPGRDGITRAYKIRTKDGTYIRPAQRLFLLELQSSEDAAQQITDWVDDKKVVTRYGRIVKKPNRL